MMVQHDDTDSLTMKNMEYQETTFDTWCERLSNFVGFASLFFHFQHDDKHRLIGFFSSTTKGGGLMFVGGNYG